MPPSQFHKFVFLMMGLAWSLCRSKEDRKQMGIPSLLHRGVDRSPWLLKAQHSLSGAWKQSSVASRQSPSGRSPRRRSSASNYLHFFQNKNIWNIFNAKMYTSSILFPCYTPPLVVHATWEKMFSLLNVST